jgi:hypothetical protein
VKTSPNHFTVELTPLPPILVQAAELLYIRIVKYPLEEQRNIFFPSCNKKLEWTFS